MTQWIVVADASRCRIYEQKEKQGGLVEKYDLIHPESRLHPRDLLSDKPGGDRGSSGQGQHPMHSKTDAKKHEVDLFVGQITDQLKAGRNSAQFDHLVLIAPSKILGALRKSLGDELLKLVVDEVDKDIVKCSIDEVSNHLKQAV